MTARASRTAAPIVAGVSPRPLRRRAARERPVRSAAGSGARARTRAGGRRARGRRRWPGGAGGGDRAQGERAGARGEAEGQHAAAHGDRAEEDGVEDGQEGQEGRVASRGPSPARRNAQIVSAAPADAARGQQPRGRRAAERDLGAGQQAEPGRGPAAHKPHQRDVAREGEDLARRGDQDPAQVGVHRASQRVREGARRPVGDDQDARERGEQPGRDRARRASARTSSEGTRSGPKSTWAVDMTASDSPPAPASRHA
jgi:hypothetical protein